LTEVPATQPSVAWRHWSRLLLNYLNLRDKEDGFSFTVSQDGQKDVRAPGGVGDSLHLTHFEWPEGRLRPSQSQG
jgi:hypothetical protein